MSEERESAPLYELGCMIWDAYNRYLRPASEPEPEPERDYLLLITPGEAIGWGRQSAAAAKRRKRREQA